MNVRLFRLLRLCGLALVLALALASCTRTASREADASGKIRDIIPTDYSVNAHWAIQSAKTPLPVDVFFVHPTTYGPPANGKYNADLDDAELNALTDRMAVRWMTAAFSPFCNVFAPRYRQVNIEVLAMDEARKAHYLETAVQDVQAALAYYLKNLNQGRPFILASHSQGSNVLQAVLLRHPEMIDKSKLVAAYMPGWSFTPDNLRAMGLDLGTRPGQTGVLLTWNTVGPGGKSPTVLKGAICVNPLSWSTDTREYPASLNLEARIYQEDGQPLRIPRFTSARIVDTGGQRVLQVPTPEPDVLEILNMSMGPEVYHRYDYDFFFQNIMDNAGLRCRTYLSRHTDR
jgi:hypothetical protein